MLTAFALGLLWELKALGYGVPPGRTRSPYLLNFDWHSVNLENVRTAETMAFMTLSLCELFRAYTVRSEKVSLAGSASSRTSGCSTQFGSSIALLLLVCVVPFLQGIFNTHFMSGPEWAVVLGLSTIPAISEEITKLFLRLRDRRKDYRTRSSRGQL